MIDIRRLRVLRAVAYYGTVTAAARSLHLTTSAASHQVRQLGRELGVVLLEPDGRGIRLTAAARSLLGSAEAIEACWEQAESELRGQQEQPVGLLRICGFPVVVAKLLAPLAAMLQSRHPQLTVQVREVEERASFDLLFDGEADLAIVEVAPDNPPLDDPRFEQQSLTEDHFDLVVGSDHPLARRRHVMLGEAAHENWVVPADACTSRTHTMAACNAAGFTPSITQHALEWHAIASLIASGLGVALVPGMADLGQDLPIRRLPITGDPRPSRKLLTCTRSGSRGQPAIAAALRELRTLVPASGV